MGSLFPAKDYCGAWQMVDDNLVQMLSLAPKPKNDLNNNSTRLQIPGLGISMVKLSREGTWLSPPS